MFDVFYYYWCAGALGAGVSPTAPCRPSSAAPALLAAALAALAKQTLSLPSLPAKTGPPSFAACGNAPGASTPPRSGILPRAAGCGWAPLIRPRRRQGRMTRRRERYGAPRRLSIFQRCVLNRRSSCQLFLGTLPYTQGVYFPHMASLTFFTTQRIPNAMSA
jgi:hypothetical protein